MCCPCATGCRRHIPPQGRTAVRYTGTGVRRFPYPGCPLRPAHRDRAWRWAHRQTIPRRRGLRRFPPVPAVLAGQAAPAARADFPRRSGFASHTRRYTGCIRRIPASARAQGSWAAPAPLAALATQHLHGRRGVGAGDEQRRNPDDKGDLLQLHGGAPCVLRAGALHVPDDARHFSFLG